MRISRATGAVLSAAVLIAWPACRLDPRPVTPVILIVADTLRKDHLGTYGYTRNTSPHLDRLAADSVQFEWCFSQAPWTTPSVASLLSSKYPSELGIREIQNGMPHETELLSEMLRRHGYVTGAVVSHDLIGSSFNFNQGYDEFYEELARGHEFISSPGVTSAAVDFVRRHVDEPFFLFVHYFDPHARYNEHPGFEFARALDYRGALRRRNLPHQLERRKEKLREEDPEYVNAIYDSDIAFTDHHIGKLLDELRRADLYDRSLIVFTADHGEDFLDHGGFGHTNELINVPLLLKLPGPSSPRVSTARVALIDVVPTILRELELPLPASLRGSSLTDADYDPSREIYSETSRGAELRAIVRGDTKLILDLPTGRPEAFSSPAVTEHPLPEAGKSTYPADPQHGAGFQPITANMLRCPRRVAQRRSDRLT